MTTKTTTRTKKGKAHTMKDPHNLKKFLNTDSTMQKKSRIRRVPKRVSAGLFVIVFASVGTVLLFSSMAASSVNSVKNGRWSDPSTWSNNTVPAAGDTVTIQPSHTVTYDVTSSPTLGKTTVDGTLTFDPAKSAKYVTNKNFVVNGKLVMKPSSSTVEHFIQFVNVNESAFVGGGMQVLDSDVGMWVMGNGQLDVAGSAKTSWTYMASTASAGATSVTLQDEPAGWRVGDTITIAPNEAPTVGAASYNTFDERTITAISGKTVSFSQGLSRVRPFVNGRWGAEVANLSRNVRIEGTYTKVASAGDDIDQDRHKGNSHIFIHANKPQFISNAQLKYMGTMGVDEGNKSATHGGGKPGRYALHFHHMGDGSRGSVVDGVVSWGANHHSFVPHASHGITMKNSIAYKGKTGAFWRDSNEEDPNGQTHDTVLDHNLVAQLVPRDSSNNAAFFLPEGHNNKLVNSSVVGIQDATEEGGYFWVNENVGVWAFDGNRSHNNNDNGMTVWQNSDHIHPIGNFAFYYNQGWGISHGAYANDYHYFNGFVYGNRKGGLELGANSFSLVQQRYENIVWDGAGISPVLIQANHSALGGTIPTIIHDNTFKGYTQHAICVCEIGDSSQQPKSLDIINPVFEGNSHVFFGPNTNQQGNRVRVQPRTGQPYQVTTGGVKTNIAPFAATDWGNGTGLLAEYFASNNFTNKTMTRLVQTASEAFAENESVPPYWITPWPRTFTIRLTGEFEAQFSEAYTFTREEDTGMRVWIGDQLVLDAWSITDTQRSGTPVQLVKGQKYPIRIEVIQSPSGGPDEDTAIYNLYIKSPSQSMTALPMSQLYCGTNPACSINHSTVGTAPTPEPSPEPQPAPDTTAPNISLTAPANGSNVSGTFDVTANASDNVGVTQVEFLVDGISRNTDTIAPYTYSLNSLLLNLNNGSHTLTARARDAAGNTRTSTQITINVNNPVPDPDPEPEPEPTYDSADLNQDGVVNLLDFSLLARQFGKKDYKGKEDINRDGKVDILDFSILAARWG